MEWRGREQSRKSEIGHIALQANWEIKICNTVVVENFT